MKTLYHKYIIELQDYQIREVPKEFSTFERYDRSIRQPLKTSIIRFQKELCWDKMWTFDDAKRRWKKGYKLTVFRPSGHQVKGWIWLTPEGELKNLYVSKWQRQQGWGTKLVLAAMNNAMGTDLDQVFYRCDIWNTASKYTIERVLKEIKCRCTIRVVEEEYE